MKRVKVVLLAVNGTSTNIIFNALNDAFGVSQVIIEEKESARVYFKRRIRKLGYSTVAGQIAFMALVAKPLSFLSKKRRNDIIKSYGLDDQEIPAEKVYSVRSVNAPETINLLEEINPDVVVVNGTRIISKKVLASVNCRFVNMHSGITPKYRGVHGTYWALVKNDLQNSGVTVHFVDEGVDTGNIIFQKQVIPDKNDNFSTYPFLQLAEGIKFLLQAIEGYLSNNLAVHRETTKESQQWYHPTIWEYFYNRLFRRVK